MPLPIAWSSEVEVDVPSLDTEHRLLLDHAAVLDNALVIGESEEQIGRKISLLVEYTRSHFESEERLMSSLEYAGYRAHKSDHDALLGQMELLKAELQPGKYVARAHLVRAFVDAWFKNHIIKADRRFAEFLKGHGVSPPRAFATKKAGG